jgi:hypothetical protein
MAANRFGQDHKDYVATDAQYPDPGNAGTITPTFSMQVVQLVTAGAGETRTVSAPTFAIGGELYIVHKTDGGDAALTFASDFDDSGNDVMTFTDAGDWALMKVGYANGSTTKAWRYVAGEGLSLS